MTYQEQLLTPEWKEKRKEIIDRDWGMCFKCSSSKNLQVHHKRYFPGLMAWEYDNFYLVTLCRDCHQLEHNIVPERQKIKSIREVIIDLIKIIQNG